MKAKATVELRVNQDWKTAWGAMLVGGAARRECWNAGAYYKIVEGEGLVLYYKDESAASGFRVVRANEPEPEEIEATDWQVLIPATVEALPPAQPVVKVGGIDVVLGEGLVEVQHHQQAQAALDEAVTLELGPEPGPEVHHGCAFPGAMRAALRGDSSVFRPGQPPITLIQMPATGAKNLCCCDEETGTLTLFRPEPDDIVAEDWIVVRH